MGVKQYKPTSPGRRFQTVSDFAEITTDKPEKSLLAPLSNKAGRNNNGRITTRHQGGGNKRRYRIIDFKRQKDGVQMCIRDRLKGFREEGRMVYDTITGRRRRLGYAV